MSQIIYLGPSYHFRAKKRVTFVISLYFLKSLTSTCYRILTKTFIKISRHSSLQMGLRSMYSRFQACKPNVKRDMLVQKIYIENEYFPILSIFQWQPFDLSYH